MDRRDRPHSSIELGMERSRWNKEIHNRRNRVRSRRSSNMRIALRMINKK